MRALTAAAALDPRTFGTDSPLAVLMIVIAAATLISEDATCIATGLLVAHGEVGFVAGSFACFAGIFVGDLLLFWAGRGLGRRALERRALRRWLAPDAVARASAWLERRGPMVIALSRLTPGMRLPTYFAAGLLETRAVSFTAYFFIAAALWTPALVAAAQSAAGSALATTGGVAWPTTAALALVLLVALRTLPPLLTHPGRRRALGHWRRLRHWEFWPLPVFYVPIVVWVGWLAVKHRSLTLPTAANPAIPGGGFAGESKLAILRALATSPEASLRAVGIPGAGPIEARLARAVAFLAAEHLAYPVVVKPDVGERGKGVAFVHSEAELRAALVATGADSIVQEFAPGREFGIFYVRQPGEEHGRIFSITEKILPHLQGDGRRTIEDLILDDERAVCMAATHFARFAARRDEVPAAGEDICLVEVGTHSRGAIFRDGAWARTPALEAAIDAISKRYEGFYFGRYDVRVERVADLLAGRGFKIVELNGLTAEATHIYHPGSSLRAAYRVLFEQWQIAFLIGRANRARGFAPTPLRELLRLVRRARPAKPGARGGIRMGKEISPCRP
jgi:membrane protein DedA with SNARE-associated domain